MGLNETVNKHLRHCMFIAAATFLLGCGAQSPASSVSSTTSNSLKLANARPLDVKINGSRVSARGCTIDLKKFCEAEIEQEEFLYDGAKYNWQMFAQNFPPHTYIYYTLTMRDGSPAATAECYIATQQRRVLSARLMPRPPVTGAAVEFAKAIGACEEQNPDYSKILATIQQNDLGNSSSQ